MNIITKIKNFLFSKPLVLTKKVEKVDTKNLEKKTKAEIEKLARKVGVELDKRLTKKNMIKEFKKQSK